MSARPPAPSGIKVLYEADKYDIDRDGQGVDIVAIHGIGAHPDETWAWKAPTGVEVNWLEHPDMLPKAVPNSRIMRFGYNSTWFGPLEDLSHESHPPKKTFVSQVAVMLLGELERHRRGITRPIIFIAHSYGGLVLMRALRSSFDDRTAWSNPFGHTAGLVFFGTPFRGRGGLSLEEMVEKIAQRNPDIWIYKETMALSVEENPFLQDLVSRFTETRRDYPIPIWCFYETYPSPVSRVIRSGDVEDYYLVPEFSACLDTSKGIEKYPLERHHYNLQKFPGPKDTGYRAVENAIDGLVREAESFVRASLQGQTTPRNQPRSQQERELLASLAASHDHELYKDLNPPKVKNTCGWFLEDERFVSWCDSPESSFLWVSAGPGRGKSVLTRSLIDEWKLSTSTTAIVCYYFFKDDDETRQHSANALSAILHQLLIQDPTGNFMRHALKRYNVYENTLAGNFSELWNILLECATTSDTREIICVMDALDECKEKDRNIIINKLENFFTDQTSCRSCKLKFFVTSRPYDTIERSIGGFLSSSCLRLDGDKHSAAINEDVDRVIDYEIPKLTEYFTDDDRCRIIKRLKGFENRTYLWLRLVIYIIKQSPSEYDRRVDIEALLNNIPDELSKAYETILNRKKSKYAPILFQLMLAAKRPLSAIEANYALVMATSETPFTQHSEVEGDLWDSTRFESTAKNFCGLLVDFHDSKLSFIHQTVREFLTDCSRKDGEWTWRGRFSLLECHNVMSLSCIRYLSLPELSKEGIENNPLAEQQPRRAFNPLDINQWPDIKNNPLAKQQPRYPFSPYAIKHWPFHYEKQHQEASEKLLEKVRKLYEPWKYKKIELGSGRGSYKLTEVAWAASLGLVRVVRFLLDKKGVDVNAHDEGGFTALCAASMVGSPAMIETLLDAGATVAEMVNGGTTPMECAVAGGHPKVVELLLRMGGEQVRITEGILFQAVESKNSDDILALLINELGRQIPPAEAAVLVAVKGFFQALFMESRLHKWEDQDQAVRFIAPMVKTKWDERALAFLSDKFGDGFLTHEVVMVAAVRNWNERVLAFLFDKLGEQALITEAVITAAAQNWNRRALEFLFDKWGEQAPITEAVMVAAVRAPDRRVLPFLFDKLGEQDLHVITEAVLVAAAEERNERALAFLCHKLRDQVPVTEAVMVAAAGNTSCGGKIIALLKKTGKQIHASEAVISAAKNNISCGKQIIALLEEGENQV